MSILDNITTLIAKKGSGFYVIINKGGKLSDVIKVIANGHVIEGIFFHGDKQKYSAQDVANLIEMEGVSSAVVFLGDVINIEEPERELFDEDNNDL